MSRHFWTIFLVQTDSNYFDVQLKVFKRDENRDLRLVPNLTMGKADFNQFIRLRNQLVIAAENFGREENLLRVLMKKLFKEMDERF